MHCKSLFIFLTLLLAISGCKEEEPTPVSQPARPASATRTIKTCTDCHTGVRLDKNHDMACTGCHHGNDQSGDKKNAHQGLVAMPAHPDKMAQSCGRCHGQLIDNCQGSLHFTLARSVNLTRKHFGLQDTLPSLTAIPEQEKAGRAALVDDMLRRRCLRCHLYSRGDDYPYVRHGTGCAACHLQFAGGALRSHRFIKKPGDWQCISCHYANHVGADYYGQFEHDFNWEYRTPYNSANGTDRPYGVELHDLAPDIHQQRGLICIDCHGDLMQPGALKKKKLTCATCHDWQPEKRKPFPANIRIRDKGLVLIDQEGQERRIPLMRHPAHKKYGAKVDCQVCHGQWSFNDQATYLLRSETDDYDMFERLTVQSSSWVEELLTRNLFGDEDELPPVMPDGITGKQRPGIWYKGFIQRRWEEMVIRRDRDGRIRVFRPILDLHLSAVDANGQVLFDNLTGGSNGYLPYTPHTTGPAGLFYEQRFLHLLSGPEKTVRQ
jgi:hypothetical protein